MSKGRRRHVPVRTCVSCRSKRPKNELVRLVIENDRVAADTSQKKKGRGVYLCDDKSCKAGFLKHRAPGGFFKTDKKVTVDFDSV